MKQEFNPANWIARFLSLGGQIATKNIGGKHKFCLVVPDIRLSRRGIAKIETLIDHHDHNLNESQYQQLTAWLDELSNSIDIYQAA